MATIDECYKDLQYQANKSGFLGNISPNDFNGVWARSEQKFYNSEYDQYIINQKISEDLSVYKVLLPITIDGAGKYSKPNDFLHTDAIRHVYQGAQVPVTRFEDDRLASNLSSTYDAPNEEFPIYVEYNTYLQFYPITLATANFVYLKKLLPGVWNYTIVGGRPVYNSGSSIQPLWDESSLDKIIALALLEVSTNMRDQFIKQSAATNIQMP